ncbi:MAG: transcription elongation factor GreA [Oscillospiraceae bacterium]|nr:transcription elongation factor GreA [Oscillospiraceae bacterium]
MESKFKMSQARYDEMVAELNYLQTVREKEVAEQIKEARSFGDLSENSEYDEAKTEQGKLYSKIAEMKKVIDNAEIIERADKSGVVFLGSRVTVRDVESDETDVYEIVGSQEANPMQMRVSDDSPIGKALIDRKKGETVTVEAPAGAFQLEILSISKD